MFLARALMLLGLIALGGCTVREPVATHAQLTDDFGDSIRVKPPSQRVVSLSPVSTEILFALGAGARVVGRTHWDLYPPAARDVPDLGNGIRPNVEAILGVHPDLVVLYASEGNRSSASRLRSAGVSTLTLRMDQISDLRRVAIAVARAMGDSSLGIQLADSVDRTLSAVRARPRPEHVPTVFWFIWESPLYTIGKGSFLSTLVDVAGARNIFDDLSAAAPQVSLEEVAKRNPDFVITGPENARRMRVSAAWRAIPAVRLGHIIVVDTALVGRPGPRLGEAARHLRRLIFGDSIP